MFERPSVVVGLEMGTSKICVVVADVTAEGVFRVLGLGQAESVGVRKGELVNPSEVGERIRKAVREAEEMADVEVREVWLGVTGAHIQGIHNRGFHSIASNDREITAEDVQDAVQIAKTINLSAHSHAIHVIRQHFLVDGQLTENPVGMFGHRVDADVLVMLGNFNRLQSAIHAVKSVSLEVEDVAFNGLASSLAVLTPEQKEIGTLVIDIGAGTTEYAVTANGVIRAAGVLTVGGDHIANDLHIGLRVPMGLADELKVKHGAARLDGTEKGKTVAIDTENGLPPKIVNLEHLRRIMAARIQELFEVLERKLAEEQALQWVHGGAVLCGGCAKIPGIAGVAGEILQVPVELGRINCAAGMTSSLDEVEFATAIGLAKYGSFQMQREMNQQGRWTVRKALSQFFGRA